MTAQLFAIRVRKRKINGRRCYRDINKWLGTRIYKPMRVAIRKSHNIASHERKGFVICK